MVVFCSDQELAYYLKKIYNIPRSGNFIFFIVRKKIINVLRYLVKNAIILKREIKRINLIKKQLVEKKSQAKKERDFYLVKTIIDKRNYKSGSYVILILASLSIF